MLKTRSLCLLAALMTACPEDDALPAERLQTALDELVEGDDSVPGAVLTVHAPEFNFTGVAGRFSFEGTQVLKTDDLFRTASVTKTFVAAAVLVLMEDGELSLEDTLRDWLLPSSLAILESDGYDPDAITLRQLISHTAGMYDYTESEAFYAVMYADPDYRWTRQEQLQLAVDEGDPLSEPGEEYHYGDTHYILAGEVLEVATGLGLAEALRTLLRYDDIGLTTTWLESLEDPPSADAMDRISHPYMGEDDTRGWDPSWDLYGGGGLVSSTDDLVRFMEALFDTESGIFQDAGTLDIMLTMPEVGQGEFFSIDGGMGINRFTVEGTDCYGGYGYFSTEVVHCPDLDLTWASTMNQSEPKNGDAITDAVLEVGM